MMGLFGLIGIMFISFFVPSMQTGTFSMVINVCAIIIFGGLTAYDTQKIKNSVYGLGTSEQTKKAAINGALMLYLDFINLFLSILRLTGDRR
jgi:FtsH-binding integral membrane protein